ncbi:aminotransferase class I/II-fold pyridoxal phosphate-dependent enzyme [Lachnospiraceae bacterium ZAX-1]
MAKLYLDESILKYKKQGYYPFHMPGHKGISLNFSNPWGLDITEIDGFDNLHHAKGIILDAQKRAATLFGAQHSYYLVNGSTCGLLSAISGAIPWGGKFLMARNSHKSVYHAVYLRRLEPIYLMPSITNYGILGSILPEHVATTLKAHANRAGYTDIKAILITSPTYDGIVSDIRQIADIAHSYHIPLIVDEAHGAHFKFSTEFPKTALSCGADVVIQSLHKTLPSFTQTALLHISSTLVDRAKIEHFLNIYQTSSPSYLFMAGMEQCIRIIESDGKLLFDTFTKRLHYFYNQCKQLLHLNVCMPSTLSKHECFDRDFSKILIAVGDASLTGQELYLTLLEKYKLQLEMVSGHYVVALSSIMDTEEGFMRLLSALLEIDKNNCPIARNRHPTATIEHRQATTKMEYRQPITEPAHAIAEPTYANTIMEPIPIIITNATLYTIPIKKLTISGAMEHPSHPVLLRESAGQVSQEYIYLYPPGIPLLAPGEVIPSDLLSNLSVLSQQGISIEGLSDKSSQRINVVDASS